MEGAALDSLQLPLEPGDALPAPESFEFCSIRCTFTEQHCMHLLVSINCKKLKHLNLGPPTPINFFNFFLGNLPNLTHLEISDASNVYDPQCLRLEACSNFIASLGSLLRLVNRCEELDLDSNFTKMLVDVHGPSLRHLSIQGRHVNHQGPIYKGNICGTLYYFTYLQSLDMVVPDVQSYHRCPDCQRHQWGEPHHFSFITPLPCLRNIKLSIRAPTTERSLLAHINKHAHCAICHLWNTFAEDPGTNLETLMIRFWRWETGRKTRVKELIYDTTRLRGRLTVKVRHNREVPTVVYTEVWESVLENELMAAFEAEDGRYLSRYTS